jgi:hypothetical protein
MIWGEQLWVGVVIAACDEVFRVLLRLRWERKEINYEAGRPRFFMIEGKATCS